MACFDGGRGGIFSKACCDIEAESYDTNILYLRCLDFKIFQKFVDLTPLKLGFIFKMSSKRVNLFGLNRGCANDSIVCAHLSVP